MRNRYLRLGLALVVVGLLAALAKIIVLMIAFLLLGIAFLIASSRLRGGDGSPPPS